MTQAETSPEARDAGVQLVAPARLHTFASRVLGKLGNAVGRCVDSGGFDDMDRPQG
jgi:hypothetical protein